MQFKRATEIVILPRIMISAIMATLADGCFALQVQFKFSIYFIFEIPHRVRGRHKDTIDTN